MMGMRRYYAAEWQPYGATIDRQGRLYADVYAFASQAERAHWVDDGPASIGQIGYRFPVTRRVAERALGWEKRTSYQVWCTLCGKSFADDCDLSEHYDESHDLLGDDD